MRKSDDVERARLLVDLARAAEQNEETAKAHSFYDDALAEFADDSMDPFLPEVLRWKGTMLRERGETDAATSKRLNASTPRRPNSPSEHGTPGSSE